MADPDNLLIAWWCVLVASAAGTTIGIMRGHTLWHKQAVLTALRVGGTGKLSSLDAAYATPPKVLVVLLRASYVVVVVGIFPAMYFHSWSRLLVLNFHLIIVGFGVAIATTCWTFPYGRYKTAKRLLTFAVGLVAVGFGTYRIYGDYFRAPYFVEGKVEGLWSGRRSIDISIDRVWYHTIHPVYASAVRGERVRAEVGAGSHTVWRIHRLPASASSDGWPWPGQTRP